MPETGPRREVNLMPRKKTSPPPAAPPQPQPCPTCKGTGTVTDTIRVGRRRRTVGQQDGICPTCFGTCTA